MASRNLLWNLTDPARPTRLTTFAGGNPVVFSRDGNLLATNGLDHDGTTTLWNVTDRTHPVNLGTITAGGTGAFSPDGSVFAAGSVDGPTTTTLWSLGGTSPVRLATVDGGAGNGPVFSPDGTLLATPADNGTVAVWNVANPASPRRIATLTCGGDTRPMAAVVFAPDGRSLVTASQSGPVALWHVADLNRPVTLSSDHVGSTQIGLSDTLTFAAFSPDGHRFATVSGNDLVTEWNVTDPDRPTRTAILTRRTYGAGQVGFTPDLGAVGGTAPDGSETVSLWHLR
jgi:WD40 repeat protein